MSVQDEDVAKIEKWLNKHGPRIASNLRFDFERDAFEELNNLAEVGTDEQSGHLLYLLDAIENGLDHPLLRRWEEKKPPGHRTLTTFAKSQRTYVAQTSIMLWRLGYKKKHARQLTAKIATLSGAFQGEISSEIVRNWERNHHGSSENLDHETIDFIMKYEPMAPGKLMSTLMLQLYSMPSSSDYDEELD